MAPISTVLLAACWQHDRDHPATMSLKRTRVGRLGQEGEIDLVNDVVIAIRGSLDAYRRDLMKRILVDMFTFEVARALDRDLSERVGEEYCFAEQQQRLVAIILALKDLDFIIAEDRAGERWFFFGERAKQLDEFEHLSIEKLAVLMEHMASFRLKKSEMARSIELSKQYVSELDEDLVKSSWSAVGVMIEQILKGRFSVIGPEAEDGLIVQDLIRSTAEQGCFVWFSLGEDKKRKPLMVDLETPTFCEGQPPRIPIKRAALAIEQGRRTSVTLML